MNIICIKNLIKLFFRQLLPTLSVKSGRIRYYVEAIIEKSLIPDTFFKTATEFVVSTHSNVEPTNMYNVSCLL